MKTIGVVGLGYVGLPLAYHLAKNEFTVVGYDISAQRIAELLQGKDSTDEIGDKISDVSIEYTQDVNKLSSNNIIIVTVPTPVNKNNIPDYTPLIKASEDIGKILQKGQIVVYESTVDPGCTEEICIPILEKYSGLKYIQDFKVGYSPERINPGDKEHTVDKINKVVGACDEETVGTLSDMYGSITTGTIHKAPSIKVAEMSKIIENTQRDVNIALINEISKICNNIGINTYDVLEASGTKWNFLNFTPGLVGGHCIGVDPYYLAQRAIISGIHPELILAGRRTNDEMGKYVASEFIKLLISSDIQVKNAKILILGLTFKENVPDFRNSKISDVINELKEYGLQITCVDPHQDHINEHILNELNITEDNLYQLGGEHTFDGIIYAQDHNEFHSLEIKNLLTHNGVLFDLKGKLRNKGFNYYKSL